MNICIIVGARPNFIKVAPILQAIDKAKEAGRDIESHLVYAGCEDDPTLEDSLFSDLQMRRPDAYLNADAVNLNELTGQVMAAFERYLHNYPADTVIVVDDLASTLAAAIVTKKQGIRLAHLVAGTRSFDINMPKEINRLVIDGLSDLLFTAGVGSNSAVTREGAEQSKVFTVGNILMDTLRMNHSHLHRPQVADNLNLEDNGYLLFTLNRKAIIAHGENLAAMLKALLQYADGKPILAPLRQSAAKAVAEALVVAGVPADNFHLISPQPYLDFGWLAAHALGVVTDSGNVAEEATFNGVPCITLNSYTEHIETVKVGTNVLVGEDAEKLGEEVKKMIAGQWKHGSLPEQWDGRTAERIVQILLNE